MFLISMFITPLQYMVYKELVTYKVENVEENTYRLCTHLLKTYIIVCVLINLRGDIRKWIII